MAMGKKRARQQPMWIATGELPKTRGHVFYDRVNEILKGEKFDDFAEKECVRFYKSETMGRPSIAPGAYFRMLMVGYFEGIDSERGIAWRCADSLSLKSFLGYALTETTPDHSTVSRTRRLIDLETHGRVFSWMLQVLAQEGLIDGKTIGVDGTTLEANAAMRSIVRRDTGESYTEFLTELAKASGIETPTQEDLAKLDRNRPKKGSNEEWEHPDDPDAKITKMKDGRTHLAHKAEHAVDMETGAVLAVTLQDANAGDTTTIQQTLIAVAEQMEKLSEDPGTAQQIAPNWLAELVTDKGYHSNDTLVDLKEFGIRSYISEPNRGRRNWIGKQEECDAVYANRRRIRGDRGKNLMRRRGLMLERPFAHCYETGRMRRTHLRGRENILKRLLIHVAGFNLSLVLRLVTGKGTPRGLQDLVMATFIVYLHALKCLWQVLEARICFKNVPMLRSRGKIFAERNSKFGTTATGCHENQSRTL
jgi:transposase